MKYKINNFIDKKKTLNVFTNINEEHVEEKIMFIYKNIDNNILKLMTETIGLIPAFKNINDYLILPKYKINQNNKELLVDIR
jgi:hypothetical protein